MTRSYHYVVAGCGLDCDSPVPELVEVRGSRRLPAIEVLFSPPRGSAPRNVSWLDAPITPDVPAGDLRIGRSGEQYVLEFPGFGRITVSGAGDQIRCYLSSRVSGKAARHAFLDRVLPLALSLHGDVVLHAGAVAVDDRGIAFVGPSGRGKSTLAAYFGRHDAEVLTDDCLVLRRRDGQWQAIPYYRGLRLWPQSLRQLLPGIRASTGRARASAKAHVRDGTLVRFRECAVPLRMMVFLGEDAAGTARATVRRLPARNAFFAILAETFSLEMRAERALRNQFNMLARLAVEVPARELGFPRRFAALPSVRTAILAALAHQEAAAA